ncbi:MAG: HPr family phosphocarrier protein [Acholeplasmataceae bacterium]
MLKQSFLVISENGIHARPATRLVNLSMTFQSEIELCRKDTCINLKSIMGLMSLGIYQGETISISTEGEDEEKAIESLKDFIIHEGLARIE